MNGREQLFAGSDNGGKFTTDVVHGPTAVLTITGGRPSKWAAVGVCQMCRDMIDLTSSFVKEGRQCGSWSLLEPRSYFNALTTSSYRRRSNASRNSLNGIASRCVYTAPLIVWLACPANISTWFACTPALCSFVIPVCRVE